MKYLAFILTLLPQLVWAACAPLEVVHNMLREKYGERPAVSFHAPQISYLLYGGKESWTLVGIKDGVACILADGTEWKIKSDT